MPKYPKEESIPPSLSAVRAIELLRKQLEQIDKLLQLNHDDPEFTKWDNFTEQIIIKAFGKPHENLTDFTSSRYAGEHWVNMPDEAYQDNFIKNAKHSEKAFRRFY